MFKFNLQIATPIKRAALEWHILIIMERLKARRVLSISGMGQTGAAILFSLLISGMESTFRPATHLHAFGELTPRQIIRNAIGFLLGKSLRD
jgi:hypothetical protein